MLPSPTWRQVWPSAFNHSLTDPALRTNPFPKVTIYKLKFCLHGQQYMYIITRLSPSGVYLHVLRSQNGSYLSINLGPRPRQFVIPSNEVVQCQSRLVPLDLQERVYRVIQSYTEGFVTEQHSVINPHYILWTSTSATEHDLWTLKFNTKLLQVMKLKMQIFCLHSTFVLVWLLTWSQSHPHSECCAPLDLRSGTARV